MSLCLQSIRGAALRCAAKCHACLPIQQRQPKDVSLTSSLEVDEDLLQVENAGRQQPAAEMYHHRVWERTRRQHEHRGQTGGFAVKQPLPVRSQAAGGLDNENVAEQSEASAGSRISSPERARVHEHTNVRYMCTSQHHSEATHHATPTMLLTRYSAWLMKAGPCAAVKGK